MHIQSKDDKIASFEDNVAKQMTKLRRCDTKASLRYKKDAMTHLVNACCDLYPDEFLDQIISAFDRGIVDDTVVDNL